MTRSPETEHLIVAHLFGELTEAEQARFEALVAEGEIDFEDVEEMRRALSLASLHKPVEPPADFWDRYYLNLMRRVEKSGAAYSFTGLRERLASAWEQVAPRARLTTQLAFAMAVLVVGVLLGRTVFAPDASDLPAPLAARPGANEDVVAAAAEEYLGRSKVLLLGIVRADGEDTKDLNLPRRKEMARELVRTAAELKPSLDNSDLRRLHELVSEIEVIMIQIANLEAEHDLPAIEMVRDGVERKGLLFKINVEEMRRLEKEHRSGADTMPNKDSKRL